MAHLYVFEMRFDLGTLDSGERSLPFGLLVLFCLSAAALPKIYRFAEFFCFASLRLALPCYLNDYTVVT